MHSTYIYNYLLIYAQTSSSTRSNSLASYFRLSVLVYTIKATLSFVTSSIAYIRSYYSIRLVLITSQVFIFYISGVFRCLFVTIITLVSLIASLEIQLQAIYRLQIQQQNIYFCARAQRIRYRYDLQLYSLQIPNKRFYSQ